MSETDEVDDAPSFEDMMGVLEGLVGRLESGELALEEALRAYEEGVSLVRRLNERLNDAERKVEILSRGRDGALRVDEADEE